MSKIVLFGPPGVGKSTTIKRLIMFGHKAIDLEDYPQDQWLSLIKNTDYQFYGAAGLHPSTQLDGCVKILLVCKNQKRYEQRRKNRDQRYPEKANQRAHTLSEWKLFGGWDKVVNTQYGDYDTALTQYNKFIASISEFLD